ncbi:FCSD flavin-binding domain-containing protein [Marinospirillum alkaliphilum]|uniref:NADPH-dependent 2,4-dienoyl-CoA reductase, sulfur reductase n=1 Tax=Marinospirillum alkaliphilum DSM 21637 TaxID=1122209 RepID=A0A1K1ZH13_9GAMM|nr:FCSD flavin-binding domain-containing protein [Marinospirillum alkaliphilum]SFX73422.1 NADPH-dependent 2,4-dienoyl-CoA reductase, sulfur reductase [Marinospirillum alkaliphilum DSM 21637]
MTTEQNKHLVSRRNLLKGAGAASLLPLLSACGATAISNGTAGRVVVVGGGFGGATAAKYIKRGNPAIDVTLVEPSKTFYTCPFSNLVLAGERSMDTISHNYRELEQVYGVRVIHALAEDVDPVAHTLRLSTGRTLQYDRLVLSPGIDFRWNAIEGYDQQAAELAPHAWKAGPQTLLLRRQLEAMEDGGVYIMAAPANPFRCPPGPYERASMIAHYFSQHKPRSKVLILDAKDNFSKQGLFTSAWKEVYGDRIEWVSLSNDGRVVQVDAARREVVTEFGTRHKASVLNVIPPQKAGFIAERAGVTNESGWVPVNPRTFESERVKDIYVVGDATVAAPMPKSGFAANAQGKVAAAAIVASLEGTDTADPFWANTCYSLISPDYGISVAGVYRLNDESRIIETPGSGGVSPAGAAASFRRNEAAYAVGWYNAISQDTWGTRL